MSRMDRTRSRGRRGRLVAWPVVCALAFALGAFRAGPVVVAREPAPSAPAFAWPVADGVGGRHHAPHGTITASNVARLEEVWRYRTGDVSSGEPGLAGTAFEATPLMADGVVYVATPRSRVVALDAETGRERWVWLAGHLSVFPRGRRAGSDALARSSRVAAATRSRSWR